MDSLAPPTTTDGLSSLLQGIQNSQAQVKAPNPYLSQLGTAMSGQGSTATSTSTPPTYDSGSVQDYVKQQSDAQFGPGEWPALHQLLMNESGFQPTVVNKSSGAGGLFQFLPSTFAGYGGTGNAADASIPDQVNAGLKYITSRYGSPSKALDFWNNIAPTQSVGGGSHWY